MNTTIVSKKEFDKLASVALDLPEDQVHGRDEWYGPFMIRWADCDTVESVHIVGTMIVICPAEED